MALSDSGIGSFAMLDCEVLVDGAVAAVQAKEHVALYIRSIAAMTRWWDWRESIMCHEPFIAADEW